MKPSHRKDVIIARIIFLAICIALISVIAAVIFVIVSKHSGGPDEQEPAAIVSESETATDDNTYVVGGCSAVELEERCFPMLAGIDKKDGQYEFYYSIDNATEPVYADGIEEAVNECESGLSKTADTNHLKVLLIGNELYDDENSYAKLIQYLKDSSKFPRNTYVCAVDDINKTFENMGDYYEQLLEKQEREEGLCLTTVGDIMDEYTNGL